MPYLESNDANDSELVAAARYQASVMAGDQGEVVRSSLSGWS
jgi:hypothetical protein